MTDRATQVATYIAASPWADWTVTPLDADASARRYLRLQKDAQCVIVMDADPATGQETQPFADMTRVLQNAGLCPPQIYAHDPTLGIMVISDLGAHHGASAIAANPVDAQEIYGAATDILIHLSTVTPPNLPKMTPAIGGEMIGITTQWYAPSDQSPAIEAAMTGALSQHCGPPDTLALRDYHLENVIWRPGKVGLNRVGLLDFQDAFITPRGYDLASLLRDVRRDVPADIAKAMIARFNEHTPVSDAALATLGAQRNLRILGVFARLALRDHKRRYLAMIPRVWSLIQSDLAHPALGPLRSLINDTIPPPHASALKDLL